MDQKFEMTRTAEGGELFGGDITIVLSVSADHLVADIRLRASLESQCA